MGISIGVVVGEQKGFEPCGDRAGALTIKRYQSMEGPAWLPGLPALDSAERRYYDDLSPNRLDDTLFFKLVQLGG